MVDLSTLNYNELVELKKRLDVELVQRKEVEKQNVLAEIQNLAAAKGFSLTDILGGGEKKGRKAAVAKGQFRNPANPAQTWTGHGRKPQWAIDWLASGRSLDELRA